MKKRIIFLLIPAVLLVLGFSLSCSSDNISTQNENQNNELQIEEEQAVKLFVAVGISMNGRGSEEEGYDWYEIPIPEKTDPNEPGFPGGEPEYPDPVNPSFPKVEFLFSGDNIQSLNLTTGEFIFKDINVDNLIKKMGLYNKVLLYLDGKLLFDPPFEIFHPTASMRFVGWGMSVFDGSIYLQKFIPNYYPWLIGDQLEQQMREDEIIFKRQEKEMAEFIQYLRETGKIVE